MRSDGPWLEVRRAAALGCLVALTFVLDAGLLAVLGSETWGGVLFLAAIGASTVSWRARPMGPGSARAPAFALSVALGVTAGALARDVPIVPLLVLGALGVAAWQAPAGRAARLAHVGLFVASLVVGFAGAPWSPGGRLVQASAGFGLGASVALLVQLGAPTRWRFALASMAAGALAGGWASL